MTEFWHGVILWLAYAFLFLVVFVLVMAVASPRGPKGVPVKHCLYAWWHQPHEYEDRDGKTFWCSGS